MSHELLTTDHKALAVNIDQRRYGTFAEIGAGQEVVRWFFHVGGAAGTIAKSISAYDMAVSDAIYGESERYVSRQRLQAMLDYEHALNLSRLQESRGDTTAFFTFADTVSARNYQGTNECHGWMGVRFQAYPRDQDSQIILHVQMLDVENALQQEALGIVGVNLLYGAFFLNHDPDKLMESLLDNLTTRRIEIDMIEFSGIAFREVDNRVMSLRLVQLGLSDAAMFSAKGEVLQPSEVLHKKADPRRARQLPPRDARQRRHAPRGTGKILPRARRGRRARRDLDGAHDAQPAGGRRAGQRAGRRRDRPARFSRPGRRAGRLRHDRADFQLLRVLPPGRLPGALHEEEDRHHDGRRQPAAISSTRSTTRRWRAASSNPSAGSSRTISSCTSTRSWIGRRAS